MKKSEMKKQLVLFLHECIERDKFNYSETVDALLDFLDSCGMLPPGYVPEDPDNVMIKLDMLDKVYKWEDE